MHRLLFAFALLAVLASASAAVVRLAPEFSIPGAGNKSKSLKSMRGQPVVLVIAESPRHGDFKKQAKNLKVIYQQFASKQVVFVAAFTGEEGLIKSDIPFAVATNGPAVAAAYGVAENFNIVIIGRDGNVDYQTNKVLPASRVSDVIQNSFVVQSNVGR